MSLSNWIAHRQSKPDAAVRLFCVPYAGGPAAIYRSWTHQLSSQIEVCPVELPGRGTRLLEKPFIAIGPLVESLTTGLLPYSDKPFALFGHSLGALICFELARSLRREHARTPLMLFASGAAAPQTTIPQSKLHLLPECEFRDSIRSLHGTPAEVLNDEDLMDIVSPILRADCTVQETYLYTEEAPFVCPISVFGGLEDELVDYQKLCAWSKQTTGGFSLFPISGNHFFLVREQKAILAIIVRELLKQKLATDVPGFPGRLRPKG